MRFLQVPDAVALLRAPLWILIVPVNSTVRTIYATQTALTNVAANTAMRYPVWRSYERWGSTTYIPPSNTRQLQRTCQPGKWQLNDWQARNRKRNRRL